MHQNFVVRNIFDPDSIKNINLQQIHVDTSEKLKQKHQNITFSLIYLLHLWFSLLEK
jgi:hypothetical protein